MPLFLSATDKVFVFKKIKVEEVILVLVANNTKEHAVSRVLAAGQIQ